MKKMSFSDKLDSFFADYIFEYKNKPTKNKTYIFADYVELLALFSRDMSVGPSYFLDRLEEKFPLDKRFLRDEGLDDAEELETISEEENQENKDEERSEINDQKQVFAESIFRFLNDRKTVFNFDYPFIVDRDSIQLKDNLNERQKTYVILLICSSLDIFRKFTHTLTSEFEIISYYVLKNYLPEHSVVKSFGKNTDYDEEYASQKIRSLAKDLKVDINEEAISQISPTNQQEKGLDLIGWIPFEDKVPNLLCILGQCACEKEFNKKLAEAPRYRRYLNFHVLEPISSLFVPYSLIQSHHSNCYIRNDEFSIDTLVFERKRILNFLKNMDFVNRLNSMKIVEKCLNHSESLT